MMAWELQRTDAPCYEPKRERPSYEHHMFSSEMTEYRSHRRRVGLYVFCKAGNFNTDSITVKSFSKNKCADTMERELY